MVLMANPSKRAPAWWAMPLVATLILTVPALGQEASAPDSNEEPKEMTEAKPVSNSDTVTIKPGETPPAKGQSSSRVTDRRRRSSSDMQSAPKVSADDVLKQFERDRPKARPLLPGSRPGTEVVRDTIGDDDPRRTPARLPEGYFLVDRAGRLTREGPWFVFNFTGDNNPAATPDPPMRLLPNRMLERMIRESKGSTTSVEFIVSGEVTDFMGENHLLLRKLLRKRSVGNLSN
ncbi:MAG: hypothetical protein DHS20C16_32930 [Phycisphaerae bacterium]|nr:MAG: hypothetical protein DHS20C16_32930 [Phycisphaerae bacterium]